MKSTFWWAGLILTCIGLSLTWATIDGPDFWWHMKIGDVIRETGLIPTNGIFSGTQATTPFTYQSWGSEVLFSWLYSIGGLSLIHLTRNILIVFSYSIVAWLTWRLSNSGRAAAIAVLLAAWVAFDNWAVRPQIFSMPLFMLFVSIGVLVAQQKLHYTWLISLPIIQIAWANIHGAFILGPLMIGAISVGASSDQLLRPGLAPTKRTILALWLTTFAVILSIFVNPQGFGIISYVMKLLTDEGSQKLGNEWASPLSQPGYPLNMFFFLMVIIGSIILWKQRRTTPSSELILWLGLSILSLTGMRYILWFGFIGGPMLVTALVRSNATQLLQITQERTPWLARLTLILAGFVLLSQAPWRTIFPSLHAQNDPIARRELISEQTPIDATEFLGQHQPSGQLFHDESFSSYLIWRLGTRAPVFVDTRVELYPLEQWYEYLCISAAKDWRPLFAKYGITTALLDYQDQARLIEQLEADADWQQIYRDQHSILYQGQIDPVEQQTALTCQLLTKEEQP